MHYNSEEILPNGEIHCACGRVHNLYTQDIICGENAVEVLKNFVTPGSTALLVADQNTWKVGGEQVQKQVLAAGAKVKTQIFDSEDLHANEPALGGLLIALSCKPDVVISIGSGTINDICKYTSSIAGIDYIAVGSAPSMDGYASNVAPLLDKGLKTTYEARPPRVIICDTGIMKTAPEPMIAAGLGDLLGKYTARADWQLAKALIGEERCDKVVALMDDAVARCMNAASGLAQRDEGALGDLVSGLVMSGIAMQMQGNSRPASGAEHHVAHFLEMRDNTRGKKSTLHGDKVGLATLMIMRLYEKLFEDKKSLPMQDVNAWEQGVRAAYGPLAEGIIEKTRGLYRDEEKNRQIVNTALEHWDEFAQIAREMKPLRIEGERILRSLNGAVRPADLGYSRQDTLDALKYAKEVRERFTILRLAQLMGRLDELAEEIADEFCE